MSGLVMTVNLQTSFLPVLGGKLETCQSTWELTLVGVGGGGDICGMWGDLNRAQHTAVRPVLTYGKVCVCVFGWVANLCRSFLVGSHCLSISPSYESQLDAESCLHWRG